eukprot:3390484-Rhodomonas_salina.2
MSSTDLGCATTRRFRSSTQEKSSSIASSRFYLTLTPPCTGTNSRALKADPASCSLSQFTTHLHSYSWWGPKYRYCAQVLKEVPVDRVLYQERLTEVPVDRFVPLEVERVKEVEIQCPVVVREEIIREIPVQTNVEIVVEKPVYHTLEINEVAAYLPYYKSAMPCPDYAATARCAMPSTKLGNTTIVLGYVRYRPRVCCYQVKEIVIPRDVVVIQEVPVGSYPFPRRLIPPTRRLIPPTRRLIHPTCRLIPPGRRMIPLKA